MVATGRRCPVRGNGQPAGRTITVELTGAEEAAYTAVMDYVDAYYGAGSVRTPVPQLRRTDADGHRLTAFATNTQPRGPGRQLADLELRHRRRARAKDPIRAAKDTALTN